MVSQNELDFLVQGVIDLRAQQAVLTQQQAEILDRLRNASNTSTLVDNTPIMAEHAVDRFPISKHTIYSNKGKISHIRKWGRLYFFPASIRDFLTSQQSQQNA